MGQEHIIAITKNLLLNKICETCIAQKSPDGYCVQYLGEAIGWQWVIQDKSNNTCENWYNER